MGEIKIKEVIKQPLARRGMAQAMTYAWQNVPLFVQMFNANAENLIRTKKETGFTYNDIIIKCMVNAVKKVPQVNSTLNGKEWIIYDDINVGVAITSEHGLFVPVIKRANDMTVEEIAEKVRELAEKTRTKTLTMDDMQDATISMSNLGPTAVETGVAILTPPQGAILFAGNIRKVPMVNENDEIVVGRQIGFSMGYDHRFLDGMIGQAFDTAFKKEIEEVNRDALFS